MANRVAICPKCETFTIIQDHYTSWVCWHQKPWPRDFYDTSNAKEMYEMPMGDKIECKVVTMERGKVIEDGV